MHVTVGPSSTAALAAVEAARDRAQGTDEKGGWGYMMQGGEHSGQSGDPLSYYDSSRGRAEQQQQHGQGLGPGHASSSRVSTSIRAAEDL